MKSRGETELCSIEAVVMSTIVSRTGVSVLTDPPAVSAERRAAAPRLGEALSSAPPLTVKHPPWRVTARATSSASPRGLHVGNASFRARGRDREDDKERACRGPEENVSATLTSRGARRKKVFAVLANPATHAAIDGTGWVQEAADRTPLTEVGQVFRMDMYHMRPSER